MKYPIYRQLVVGDVWHAGDLYNTADGLKEISSSSIGNRIAFKRPRDIFLRQVGELTADFPGDLAIGYHACS